MKRNLPIVAVVVASLLALVACNPNGTCMKAESESERAYDLGDACTINATKRLCSNMQGEFFAEDGTAGLVRCKSLGYVEASTERGRDPKALRTLYRRKPKVK